MKKCPVCGVMMGDNVARCFMCKYDFQKAAREGEEIAREEAAANVRQVELNANERVAEKKAEEEKLLSDTQEHARLELEALQRQLEGEKLRLEQEYVEARKKSLEERTKLDNELAAVRKQIAEENKLLEEERQNRNQYVEETAQIGQEKADKLLKAAQDETAALAIQVQKEYNEAVNRMQQLLDESNRLQSETVASQTALDKIKQEYASISIETEAARTKVEQTKAELRQQVEKETADLRKQAETEAAEYIEQAKTDAARITSDAETAHNNLLTESNQIMQQMEINRKQAEEELNAYIAEAKAAIAAADEAQAARSKAEEDIRRMTEQAASAKEQAEEDARRAQEDARKAQDEVKDIILQTEAARQKAQQEAQSYLDEVEVTRRQAREEVQKILDERQAIQDQAEKEAAELIKEIEEARAGAEESKEARNKALEEAEAIILEAQKRAVAIKELAVSQSEKGRITKELEASRQEAIDLAAALQQKLADCEAELAGKDRKVSEIMEELNILNEQKLQAGLVPVSVPMEYEVEIIRHLPTGEVDSESIADKLAKRGPEGWKLHSLVNDEGGRLQASVGAGEKYSLASGASFKEDRVILIFERVAAADSKNSSSNV